MTTVTIQVTEEYDMGYRDGWSETSNIIERQLDSILYEAQGRLVEGQDPKRICEWLIEQIECFEMPEEP